MIEDQVAAWGAGIAFFADPLVMISVGMGTFIGLFFGVVPGLTAVLALVLLLPLTYGMTPAAGLALLISAYVGGITGGLVSAVMLGIPGTPASITTVFDGHALAKKGMAGRALGWGVVASFFGGLMSWLALSFLTPQLAKLALSFGPFEYAAIIIFGFTIVGSLAADSALKGLIMTALGVLLAAIGLDPLHGVERMTFGLIALEGGFGLVPLLVGVYILSQVFVEAERMCVRYVVPHSKLHDIVPRFREMWDSRRNLLRSSMIGIGIGILPGIGAVLANFIAYDRAKKNSKDPDSFGLGNVQGVIASETANNATIGAAMVPLLALGIPGDAPVVVLMGGLMLHGIRPGPLFLQNNVDMMYFIFVAYLAANIIMLVFMLAFGLRLFCRLMVIPKTFLLPTILLFGLLGSYNVSYSLNDVGISITVGLFAYVAIKAHFPLTPLVIGVILGPLFEYNLRVALTSSKGSLLPFVQEPVSVLLLAATLGTVIILVFAKKRKRSGFVADDGPSLKGETIEQN